MSADIDIKQLTKWYRKASEPAVRDLSIHIRSSEIFGLLGPNGAGKTTTISILCNQSAATSGEILIDGKSLTQHRDGIKRIIGVAPQEIALYPTLTALENLRFFGRMYGLKGKSLEEKIRQSLADFGLEHKMNKRVRTFSGGMKRRVNLIAGLLHEPRILILDEPTVGIDVQSKTVILEYLTEMNRTKGTTIVYTSHMMDEAENFCTHIGIIDRGSLIAEGVPAEMIREHENCNKLEDIFLHLTGKDLRDH